VEISLSQQKRKDKSADVRNKVIFKMSNVTFMLLCLQQYKSELPVI